MSSFLHPDPDRPQRQRRVESERQQTLPIVLLQKPAIFEQLRAYWPEPQTLDGVTADDMVVDMLPHQGNSNATYHVHVGNADAVLTVPLSPNASLRMTHPQDRYAYKQHLQAHGLPIVPPLGPPFSLSRLKNCELHAFAHGHCYDSFEDMPSPALHSYATALARLHKASTSFSASHTPEKPWPFNDPKDAFYAHSDMHVANVVFDSNEQLSGIIDFEFMRKTSRSEDIARNFHFLRKEEDGTVSVVPQSTEMLRYYHAEYPLTTADVKALCKHIVHMNRYYLQTDIPRAMEKELYTEFSTMLAPLAEPEKSVAAR